MRFNIKQTLKHCPRCNQYYPATTEYFNKDKSRKYEISSYCKKCHNEYRRKSNTSNKLNCNNANNTSRKKNYGDTARGSITIRLKQSKIETIKELAYENNKSVSEAVREYINDGIRKDKNNRL